MRMVRDKYSEVGATAWRHWFNRCAIERCDAGERSPLRDFVCSAIRRHIRRIPDVDINLDDFTDEVVAHNFDAYMCVGGNVDNPKPHKQLLGAQFDASCDGSLKEMICGKIFSREKGLVREIARKTIEDVYGWNAHAPRDVNGRRVMIFEKPFRPLVDEDGNELEPRLEPVREKRPGTDWTSLARGVIFAIGGNSPIEAPLLAYAICTEVNKTSPALQRHLGVGPVMTSKKYNAAMHSILVYMKRHGLSNRDAELIHALREESGLRIGPVVRRELAK